MSPVAECRRTGRAGSPASTPRSADDRPARPSAPALLRPIARSDLLEHGRGLDGRAGGDRLGRPRTPRPARRRARRSHAETPCSARAPPTSEDEPVDGAVPAQRVERVEQPAGDSLDRRPRQLLAGHVAAQPASTPVASGRFGRALAVEVRQQRRDRRRRAAGERQLGRSSAWSTPSSRANASSDLGGVQRADQRQEPAGGVGESGDAPVGSAVGVVAHRERRAGRAERDHRVDRCAARARAPPPCCRPCPGHDRRLATPRRLERAEHRRARRRASPGRRRRSPAGPSGTPRWRRPVPGARGVAPIGREPAGEPHASASRAAAPRARGGPRPSGALRCSHDSFVTVSAATGTLPTASPKRHGDAAPAGQSARSASGVRRGLGVVPQLGRMHRPIVASSATMPCCCPAMLIGGDAPASSARPLDRRRYAGSNGAPPVAGLLLAERRGDGGCGDDPRPTTSPESRSRISTLVDCVDESTPATSGHASATLDASRVRAGRHCVVERDLRRSARRFSGP